MGEEAKKEYIKKSVEFLDCYLDVLEDIIHKIQNNKDPKLYGANITIVLMLFEFLKILDGVLVLIECKRFRATITLVRSLIELTLQIIFLCDDRDTVDEKDSCYKLFTIYKSRTAMEHDIHKQDLSKNVEYQKYKKFETESRNDYVKKKQSELQNILKKPGYLNFWFSLYDKKLSSIRALIYRVKAGFYIELLYGKLSQITHGGDVISNIKINGNQLSLNNLDNIENGHFILSIIANLMDLLFCKLDEFYSNPGEHIIFDMLPKNFINDQRVLYDEIKLLNNEL